MCKSVCSKCGSMVKSIIMVGIFGLLISSSVFAQDRRGCPYSEDQINAVRNSLLKGSQQVAYDLYNLSNFEAISDLEVALDYADQIIAECPSSMAILRDARNKAKDVSDYWMQRRRELNDGVKELFKHLNH